jgi:hypothetical protein
MTEKDHDPTPENSPATPDGGANNANPSFKTRFQKGRSGNPHGRPRGSKNKKNILEEILNEEVSVRTGKGSRKISKFELVARQIVNEAAKGDPKAQTQLLAWIKVYDLVDKLPEPDILKPLTANDDALLANFVARIRGETFPRGDDPIPGDQQ